MSFHAQFESRLATAGLPGFHDPDAGEPQSEDDNRRGESRQAAGARILVVEDDHAICDVLHDVLEDEGYVVLTAPNGREALDALRTAAAPDLIILDLRMPVMDGWQFRALQKSDLALAGIPVIAVSADGSPQAAAIDAAAYLRKPLSTESLLDAVSRILADAERRKLLGRLEEAERFAALGRLAASVGHEINNPLAYVSMNVDLATQSIARFLESQSIGSPRAGGLEAVPPMLADCRVGLDRIRDVVKDLQHLSRQSQPKREPFPVNELLEESLAIARNHIQHRAQVRKDYGLLPPIVGDRSALGQVLLNLLLNAAQALPEGHAQDNAITLRTSADGENIMIEIDDTGAGIPPHVLPHIFDPFFTTKPIGEGTGLGLAVSCRIIADHGGHIDVDSEEGRGSRFRVVLPFPTVAVQATPDDDEPTARIVVPRARILVVDDVAAIGRMIGLALPEHDVTVVSRAADAFARLAEDAYDLVICDVLMPDLGGREVLARLEADWPDLAETLVFMTGGAFTAESRELLGRSSHPVLEKPFSIESLRSAVVSQLRGQQRARN
jgi:two-component system cell cycle sensor histidine kinase/response regulator CckA